MSKHCKPGNCHAGMIGTRTIIESEWADELAKFLTVIDDWNEKTKRFAIPHPGFSNRFIHCPQCGKRLCE
ncbi:hypothetical protein [Serratia fonticola]|uniref:hypothetical protein n=1 Tax=Serratia fonticola TaxID=47917 RepID=UPI003AB00F84|nr:hypothetical protein [Serratia fonticola]HBE9093637.1 hypothetical protein [Serratia fonticola]HBE9152351.1 hypothetical protein [Serratia fonticola]